MDKVYKSNPDEKTIIEIKGITVGDGSFPVIAGPCSVESREQIMNIAAAVKASGAKILRGGAFKPRTSPYDFQGLGKEGIEYLTEAGRTYNMPVVTEIMSDSQIDLFKDVDILQVGARNMQNFQLLKALSVIDKPILLKRGPGNTLEELLMSAEYILKGGNSKVILCERGIRTFETATRYTLDLSAVVKLHEITHLPVIVDPSHALGDYSLIKPMAMAACACLADGLMIEVHDKPEEALSDSDQSVTPKRFKDIAESVNRIHEVLNG